MALLPLGLALLIRHLYSSIVALVGVSYWILLLLATYQGVVIVCLAVRFLKTKYGSRIQPSGSKGILITGATSGLGLEAAAHFYLLGFSVFACYYDDQEIGYRTLQSLGRAENRKKPGARIFLVQMDVRSQESIEQSSKEIDRLMNELGVELYCLINNAGIGKVGPFEWASRKSIRDTIETNLTGTLMVTRQFLLKIIKCKGRVVNVSSGLQSFPCKTGTVYGATKSALAYFSDALNEDIKQYGASCHCVMPGNFLTASNIIYSRLACAQESEKRLSEEERTNYEKSLADHKRVLNDLLAKKKLGEKLILEKNLGENKQESIQQQQLSDKRGQLEKDKRSWLARLISKIDGSACVQLETSGVIVGYDQAVCLKTPPRRLYAGNALYTYIAGPSFDYLPQVLYGPITPIITQSIT